MYLWNTQGPDDSNRVQAGQFHWKFLKNFKYLSTSRHDWLNYFIFIDFEIVT